MSVLINYGIPVFLLALGFVAGQIAEARHYRSIRRREKNWIHVPAITNKTLFDEGPVLEARAVVGSTVISVDHYKRFLMYFRRIFGGEIRSYLPLIDRGRREAILRMKESCPDADLFLNCRLETSTISNGQGNSTGTVEFLAYATAIRLEK